MLTKARNSLRTAKVCFDMGDCDAALSRAYYAMYQAVLATLRYFNVPISREGTTSGGRWEHETVPIAIMEYLGYPEEFARKLQFAYRWRVDADYLEDLTQPDRAQLVIQYAEEMIQRVQEDIET